MAACLTLHVWGANGHGQLGLGHTRENEANVPTKVCVNTNPNALRQIVGGGSHSILITENGTLFGCGNNSKSQLGFKDTADVLYFTPLNMKLKVRQIACGWEHTLALTDDGELFVWGANNFLQLGLDLTDTNVDKATKVEIKCRIVDISAGLRHSLALTENGDVYSWGDNRKGQLGRPDDSKSPKMISRFKNHFVKKVICGAYHSAALNDSGTALVWGLNNYGQLGMNPEKIPKINEPGELTLDGAVVSGILELYSGWTHFIAKTANGDVYSWGRNDYGQLGRLSEKNFDWRPGKIPNLKSPEFLCCGSEHNAAVIRNEGTDNILTWGWNEHGICGNGNEENVKQPTQLILNTFRVLKMGCGSGQNLILLSRDQ